VHKLTALGHVVYFGINTQCSYSWSAQTGAVPVPFDFGCDNSITSAVTSVLKAEHRIDTLLYNTKIPLFGALELVSFETAERYLNETLVGLARFQNAVLPSMRAQNAGRIIILNNYCDDESVILRGWENVVAAGEKAMVNALTHELINTSISVELLPVFFFIKGNERPYNQLNKQLHNSAIPRLLDMFAHDIQLSFETAPDFTEYVDRIANALIAPPPQNQRAGGISTLLGKKGKCCSRPLAKTHEKYYPLDLKKYYAAHKRFFKKALIFD